MTLEINETLRHSDIKAVSAQFVTAMDRFVPISV